MNDSKPNISASSFPTPQWTKLPAVFVWFAVTTASFGQSAYNLQIIVKTGDQTPNGNTITALGNGPSINDAGKVAYVTTIQDGRQGVFVSGEAGARSTLIDTFPVGFSTFSGLARNFNFPAELQINNRDQIAWKVWSRDGLFSFIFRLGSTVADYKVVAKTLYDRIDTPDEDFPSPFCGPFPFPTTGLSPLVSLNNSGRTVFSGIQCDTGNRYVLATPRNPAVGGHNLPTDFYISPPLLNVSNFFPQIADTDAVVARGGRTSTAPIMLFVDPTLDPGAATFIATSSDYDALGERPGISDDGKVVVFMGAHKTQDVGIYLAVIGSNKQVISGPFKITGFSGFSAFIEKARVGAGGPVLGSASTYAVVYLAFGESGVPGQAGPLGIYVSLVDLSNLNAPVIAPPNRVARVGDPIAGLAGSIQNIALYDPINSRGQLAFWVSTTAGSAIIRATGNPVILVHGWHGGAANWDLVKTYLEMDGYSAHVLEYDDTLAPAQAAAALNSKVASVLDGAGATKVDLITHSYGGLVARHFIEEMGQGNKVRNLIMISPPNHGSRLADYLVGTLAEQPQAGIVERIFDFYSTLFRADRTWGSSLAMRTLQNDYLDTLNLLFGSRLPNLTTHYFVITGIEPYPARFGLKISSHGAFLAGPDDGAVAARSARLAGVPLYCVPLNHSAIVNPRLVREWDSPPDVLENTPALDQALDEVLTMYTDIIRPILKGTPPATDSGCADTQDPNDDQQLLDILTRISVGVHIGDVVSRSFEVAEGTSTITVTFTHRFSEFEFCLRTPSGQIICTTNAQQLADVDFIETTNAMSYTVHGPQPGQWQLMIHVIDVPVQGEDLNIYVLSQPSSDRPRLWADRSEGQIALSWAATFNGFLLECRNSLSLPPVWFPLTNTPVHVGDRWTVSLPVTNSTAFYRLRKQ